MKVERLMKQKMELRTENSPNEKTATLTLISFVSMLSETICECNGTNLIGTSLPLNKKTRNHQIHNSPSWLYIPTVEQPNSVPARKIRVAISPRFAAMSFPNGRGA